LPILECADAYEAIENGDQISIDLSTGEIKNLTRPGKFRASPFPDKIKEIIELGGLEEYVRHRLGR
jgi:3-isopropylmalate/(R)-2-methylmalate dehydratase small subunit